MHSQPVQVHCTITSGFLSQLKELAITLYSSRHFSLFIE